jgi:hypothetical protein
VKKDKDPTKNPVDIDKSKSLTTSASSSVGDDGFAGWDDRVEGDDQPENVGIIQGTFLKFSNEGQWIDRDGNEIPDNLELCAAEVLRLVQKWEDQKPVETIILEPHQKFPDVEAMNDAVPRDEWEEGPGGLRGPWQAQHLLRLVNLETMEKYSYPTGTTGGRIAVAELRDRIVWMRRYKGNDVYAIVTLGRTWWNTKHGGRWRPTFVIKRWARLGGGGGGEAKASPAIPPTPTAAPVQQVVPPQLDLPLVAEPTLQEELNDSIPDFGNPKPQQSKPQPAKSAPKKPGPKLKTLKTTARRDLKKKTTSPRKPGKPASKKQTILDAG